MNDTTLLAVCAATGFAVTAFAGLFLVPYLRRLKFGQTIKEIGPTWHAHKQGIPTMGGFMFWTGILIAAVSGILYAAFRYGADELIGPKLANLFGVLLLALGFGFIGFVDDYIKVVKKRNLGLRAREKLLMQVIVTFIYLISIYFLVGKSTIVAIPFFGAVDFGFWYYPFASITMIGFVNAVNQTDGIDGLCSSVSFVASVALMLIAGLLASLAGGILAAAVAGAMLGFLVWNFHPAQIFMGDTGSFFLGGMMVGICFAMGRPVLLFLVGIIYLVESFSVILQVISFKLTGKRIFKMTPIHHSFEMSGWSENKIVVLFSIVTAIFSVAAFFWIKFS